MKAVFKNKRISGLLGILPQTFCYYDDEVVDSESVRHQRIKKNMGYNRRYCAKAKTTVSMLCNEGMKYLLKEGIIEKNEIGAVLVVSFTPDYYVPHVSNLIQAANELPSDILTMDLWSGCAGYVEGLQQAFMLLDNIKDKKVLLFTGDVICRKDDFTRKFNEPVYGGDGASITIIENADADIDIPFVMKTNGKYKDLVAFKQGGFADLFHQKAMENDINAQESFHFFQSAIPNMIYDLMDYSNVNLESIDMFNFVQANKLSIKKFADSLGIPYEKIPMDLVAKYGDTSASLNPIGIIDHYGDSLMKEKYYKVLICGYGAGLKWGATIVDLGNLCCCKSVKTEL